MTDAPPMLFQWDGEAMHPAHPKLADKRFVVGERYSLIEHQALLAASPQWRPIESAPKDGTSFLGYPHFIVTHWTDDDLINGGSGFAGRYDEQWERFTPIRLLTHWMPLPLAPRPATPPVAGAEGGDTKPLPVSSPEGEAK